MGIAALAVRNSYNCGLLGFHTDRLARAGLIGIGFTDAPASIAPTGGHEAIFGTNPIAMPVPDGKGGVAFSIDQSASAVAKSEAMRCATRVRASLFQTEKRLSAVKSAIAKNVVNYEYELLP